MFAQLKNIYHEFPRTFWTLIGAMFIDQVGGALIFPFLSLYITQKFGVGMIQVGVLFAIFAAASLLGSLVAGAITDRFGRKAMIIFGLLFSALTALSMGFVNELKWFYSLSALVGLLSNAAGPAYQAMVADMLPEEKRTQGFSTQRVVLNLAITIGPVIGGLLASVSFLLLFILDAVASAITAGIIFVTLPETRPQKEEDQPEESLGETLLGYGAVLRDRVFIFFLVFSILMYIVYMQLNSTLPVFLRDVHGIPARGFGYLLSLNALMVVVLQFWITRRTTRIPPMLLMVSGALLYAIGFLMFGFFSGYAPFILAIVIITLGEMLSSPTSQALVAHFAPADMRGRYMAAYGFVWIIPSMVGPLAAGVVMDHYDPNWVWYIGGGMLLVSAAGFAFLHRKTGRRFRSAGARAPG